MITALVSSQSSFPGPLDCTGPTHGSCSVQCHAPRRPGLPFSQAALCTAAAPPQAPLHCPHSPPLSPRLRLSTLPPSGLSSRIDLISFFPAALLRHNWQIKSYTFQVYHRRFHVYIHAEMSTTTKLTNTSVWPKGQHCSYRGISSGDVCTTW